ncbi:MAG: hypothetical protein JXR41_14525 [Bacteroidales bacterium]|nr:hypothetical protein [Bacteroidales bacterium]MBN2764306.1 hypothetical protein [Bacteroidales bacterium]
MIKRLVYFLLAVLIISSCKSGGDRTADSDFEIPDSVLTEGLEISEETMQNVVQNISSPVEMAALIKELGVPYSNKYLSSTARVGKLSTNFQQSLNLGIYGADLGYLNMYNKTSAVIDYISAIKTLADDIKVGQFFDFTTLKRLATNNQNLDSLMYISVHSFNQMDKYLHSNKRSNLSALIITGVWIEGLYLGTQVAKEAPNDQLAERIGEQKITLNELILILENFKNDKQYAKLIRELLLIKEQYKDVVIRIEKGEPQMIEEDGMLTIVQNDKSIIEISPEQLNGIIITTEKVRNRLISL